MSRLFYLNLGTAG